MGGTKTIKFLEEPRYRGESTLSSKGQIVITAAARKMLSKSAKFEQSVFRDGTIVLTPSDLMTKKEKFLSRVNSFQQKYGTVEDTEFFGNITDIGEEYYD